MRYVCLVHVDGAKMAALSEDERKKLTDETIDQDWEMKESGHLIMATPLQPPSSAVVVRVRDGKLSSTDGPYSETKEFLGGFIFIESRDLNEAVQIAARSPMARMGSIEVRPVLDQTHSETGRPRPKI